jgi:hypothetical protein
MTTVLSNRRSKFGMTCVHCDNELIAPKWSQYQSERRIRHLWHCSECDLCFESAVSFPAVDKPMVPGVDEPMRDFKTGNVIFPSLFPSLLVA